MNWRRLKEYTTDVWDLIIRSAHACPPELRRLFRHIRDCARDCYGDGVPSVAYTSVSGLLFLRFFCPAILNPHLFGLVERKHPLFSTAGGKCW